MKKIMLLTALFAGLCCAGLSAQSCCIPNPACKAICTADKAETKACAGFAAVQTSNTAAPSQTATASRLAAITAFLPVPAADVQPGAKSLNCDPTNCDPSQCDPSNCDPSKCDLSKCDLSKCPPGSGLRKNKV